MKIALCLYGQPRNYIKGYETIKTHILDKYDTDIFFHSWETDTKYDVSPWRIVDNAKIDLDGVIKLYKPKSFLVEKSMTFYPSLGVGYNKTPYVKNSSNILSQYYSRTMVRNIFLSYCQNNSVSYDVVIATRFDINICKFPPELNPEKILFCISHPTRPLIFNDNIIISNANNFIKLFNIYPNINRYILAGPCQKYAEQYPNSRDKTAIFFGTVINSEELLSASLIDNDLIKSAEKTALLEVALF